MKIPAKAPQKFAMDDRALQKLAIEGVLAKDTGAEAAFFARVWGDLTSYESARLMSLYDGMLAARAAGDADWRYTYRDPAAPRRFTIPAKGQPHGVRVAKFAGWPVRATARNPSGSGYGDMDVASDILLGTASTEDEAVALMNTMTSGGVQYDRTKLAMPTWYSNVAKNGWPAFMFTWAVPEGAWDGWKKYADAAPPTKYAASTLRSPAMRREERALAKKFAEGTRKFAEAEMWVKWFPINSAWGVLWGTDIATAQHLSIDGQKLFQSREQLVTDLRYKGLVVAPNGRVTSEGPNPFDPVAAGFTEAKAR